MSERMESVADREAAQRVRERARRFKGGLLAVGLAAAAAAVGLVLAMDGSALERRNALILLILAGALAVGAAVLIATAWPNAETRSVDAGLSRRDREQRQRRATLFAMPVQVMFALVLGVPAVVRLASGEPRSFDWMMASMVVLWAWVMPAAVMGWDGASRKARKFLEDELTQALRGRAMTLGYVVLLAGVSGVYLLGLWRPDWAMMAFPFALAIGAVTPALRFALLDRAAEGDDG